MIIKVKRLNLEDYQELVEMLGYTAKTVKVPSTLKGVEFVGCYTDKKQNEIAVAWPVDRPEYAQYEYSEKYHCGFPVDEFDPNETLN